MFYMEFSFKIRVPELAGYTPSLFEGFWAGLPMLIENLRGRISDPWFSIAAVGRH